MTIQNVKAISCIITFFLIQFCPNSYIAFPFQLPAVNLIYDAARCTFPVRAATYIETSSRISKAIIIFNIVVPVIKLPTAKL
jgi:hypothetical protein